MVFERYTASLKKKSLNILLNFSFFLLIQFLASCGQWPQTTVTENLKDQFLKLAIITASKFKNFEE